MKTDSNVRQLLAAGLWRCFPYAVGTPATLEAEFFNDHKGTTIYLRDNRETHIPDRWAIGWTWDYNKSNPGVLNIAWSNGESAKIEFEITDDALTLTNGEGKETTFTSKLTLSAQLFPPGVKEFPHGWVPEYFTDDQKAVDIRRNSS